jgi:hypothetical protein
LPGVEGVWRDRHSTFPIWKWHRTISTVLATIL